MKIFISQPMQEKTGQQIKAEREPLIKKIKEKGWKVIDSIFDQEAPGEIKNQPVFFLAKSIDAMSQADAVVMCEGWLKARDCRIEHKIAKEYNIKIIYDYQL